MLTKKNTHFFNNISHILYPPPTPPCRATGSGSFFCRLFLKTIFLRPQPSKIFLLIFIFYSPRCATGRENFLYRTFCGKIFVSSPTKNYTLTPVSISNIKSFINSQEKKSKLYPHGTLYPLYLTAKHRIGFNPLLCRYMLSLL